MEYNLLPADVYIVLNQTILTEVDKKTLINLYEPIIGPIAVSLYLTLWSDLDNLEIISREYNHHHLMTILKSDLKSLEKARLSLESVGLIKTLVKKNDNKNEYLYELYSPLSPKEFFTHPILSVLLKNNIGEMEFNSVLDVYKKVRIKKDEYIEISARLDEVYKVVNPADALKESVRHQKKLDVNMNTLINFDSLLDDHNGSIKAKTFTKKTKEFINQLAFVYNINTIKMKELINASILPNGNIDKDALRKIARKSFEYNNGGSLPTLVYRTQPSHLNTPKGDESPLAKYIYELEHITPYDFLKSKNKGVRPIARDLELLEHLAIDFELPPGVINVLVDYVLRVNNGRLIKKYMEAIASDWSRNGIKTVKEAMEIAKKSHKKIVKDVKPVNKKIVTPSWLNADIKSVEMGDEELEELKELMKDFR